MAVSGPTFELGSSEGAQGSCRYVDGATVVLATASGPQHNPERASSQDAARGGLEVRVQLADRGGADVCGLGGSGPGQTTPRSADEGTQQQHDRGEAGGDGGTAAGGGRSGDMGVYPGRSQGNTPPRAACASRSQITRPRTQVRRGRGASA